MFTETDRRRWMGLLLLVLPLLSCRGVDEVELRAFPYPFRAALAISSDIDETDSVDEFLTIQRYLAATGSTPLGEGLGLEVGSSFWFYDATGRSEFTYFQDLEGTLSPEAELMEEFMAAGYLDCLHSYGDFSEGGFSRTLAQSAVAALEDIRRRRGVTIRVWVDHGNPLNRQNLGKLSYQKGDNPGSPEYHTDLVIPYGMKFLGKWDVTHIIGQDAHRRVHDYLKELGVLTLQAKNAVIRREQTPYLRTNRLIHLTRLDDGRPIYAFRRFINSWGHGSADARGVVEQLSDKNLRELLAKGGYMVLYTHLGGNEGETEYLPRETRDTLGRVARLQYGGQLFVTTSSRLLNFNMVHHRLRWRASVVENQATIEIDVVDDEVEGSRVPRPEDLMGITFYVPSAEDARVLVAGEEVQLLDRNPPDETGRESVGFPWDPLCYPLTHEDEEGWI